MKDRYTSGEVSVGSDALCFTFTLPHDKGKITLGAASPMERDEWVSAFQQALGQQTQDLELQHLKKMEETMLSSITFTKVKKIGSSETIQRGRRATVGDIFSNN